MGLSSWFTSSSADSRPSPASTGADESPRSSSSPSDPRRDTSTGPPYTRSVAREPLSDLSEHMIFRRSGSSGTEPAGTGSRKTEAGQELEALRKAAAVAEVVDGLHSNNFVESESDTPLQSLNALLEAAYTHSSSKTSFIPPPYIVDEPPRQRFESVLPPALVDFAARYPLTTIASLGALGTGVLLGSGLLTARLIRGASRARALPHGLDARLDDLERRLVDHIRVASIKNQTGLDALFKAVDKGKAAQKGMAETALKGKAAQMAMSASALIAPAMDEARLGQVVRQALEDVLSAKGWSLPSKDRPEAEEVMGKRNIRTLNSSMDRLHTLTASVLDELKLLRAAQATTPVSTALKAKEEGIMSLKEVAEMVKRVQEASSTARSDIDVRDPVNGVSDVNEAELAEADAVNRAICVYDLPGKEKAGAVVAEEVGKAVKTKKKKKAKAAAGVAAAETGNEQSLQSADPSPESVDSASSVDPALPDRPLKGEAIDHAVASFISAQTPQTEASQPEAEPADLPNQTPIPPQGDTPVPRKAKARKATPLPPSEPIAERESKAEEPAEQTPASSSQPLGIDETGAWSFRIVGSYHDGAGRDWQELNIVLQRERDVVDEIQMGRWGPEYFLAKAVSSQSLQAFVLFTAEVDVIRLDDGIWRCERSGAGFNIRERLADA